MGGRRTYITRLANKGVGVRLLAALAGHSHEELETLQSYDKLEVKVERLVRDVLVQKALKNSFRYKL